MVAGIDWAVGQHRDRQAQARQARGSVMILALGGHGNAAVDAAARAAAQAGIAVVASAGNHGNSEDSNACHYSPGREQSVITVGALALASAGASAAAFSNRGPCVDLFAPGTDVVSAWTATTNDGSGSGGSGGSSGSESSTTSTTAGTVRAARTATRNSTSTQSGTSMAAARVAGAAAIELELLLRLQAQEHGQHPEGYQQAHPPGQIVADRLLAIARRNDRDADPDAASNEGGGSSGNGGDSDEKRRHTHGLRTPSSITMAKSTDHGAGAGAEPNDTEHKREHELAQTFASQVSEETLDDVAATGDELDSASSTSNVTTETNANAIVTAKAHANAKVDAKPAPALAPALSSTLAIASKPEPSPSPSPSAAQAHTTQQASLSAAPPTSAAEAMCIAAAAAAAAVAAVVGLLRCLAGVKRACEDACRREGKDKSMRTDPEPGLGAPAPIAAARDAEASTPESTSIVSTSSLKGVVATQSAPEHEGAAVAARDAVATGEIEAQLALSLFEV